MPQFLRIIQFRMAKIHQFSKYWSQIHPLVLDAGKLKHLTLAKILKRKFHFSSKKIFQSIHPCFEAHPVRCASSHF